MQMQFMSVRDTLSYEFIKKNPIQTEAKNILNKLFQDDFGFFDSGMANRVQWFLPKEIKDMNLFYLVSSKDGVFEEDTYNMRWFEQANPILATTPFIKTTVSPSPEYLWTNTEERIYISPKSKIILQREIAKYLEVPFFKKSYTFCEILKNSLFVNSFDGNEPISTNIIMECISSKYETTQEMISIMNRFLSDKLHFNGNHSFFDKEIFVNIADVNDDVCKNFKEVSFRAFDNDDIDTSFFISNDLIEKLYTIEIVAQRNIEMRLEQADNQEKLQSIFR
jgi:hypothetical protein